MNSYRGRLRELYRRLDETSLGYEVGAENRKAFFRQARAEFLFALQLNRDHVQPEISDYGNLDDRDFFRLCASLGGTSEVSVFIEKVEKALTPGLRQSRRELAKSLKTYGVTFADD